MAQDEMLDTSLGEYCMKYKLCIMQDAQLCPDAVAKHIIPSRHRDTGKPRGFAFLAYEDQRSTNLAVDNLNGMKVGGRMITVDHVDNYKRKRAEVQTFSLPHVYPLTSLDLLNGNILNVLSPCHSKCP